MAPFLSVAAEQRESDLRNLYLVYLVCLVFEGPSQAISSTFGLSGLFGW